MNTVPFRNRRVGDGEPPYVIAEIGSNHNGDMDLCRRTIDAAKECGADAAKFQSWSATSLVSSREYARNTSYGDKKRHFASLKEMVETYQLTPEQHHEAKAHCDAVGIDFLSSAFSPPEVDLLDSLDVPAFKVASMDVDHLPLLQHVASKGRPVMLSTGMATLAEIDRALRTLRAAGSGEVIVLHCVSAYPAPMPSLNLRNLETFRAAFQVLTGFSDHTLGLVAPIAAVALGACVIEKHFTLDKDLPGWDHHMSADPAELRDLVAAVRDCRQALGSPARVVSEAELEKRKSFRRRIVARHPLEKGAIVRADDLDYKRPGNGIGPDEVGYVVGRALLRDVDQDEWLEWTDFGAPGQAS